MARRSRRAERRGASRCGPGGETLLARGRPPDPRASRAARLRASDTTVRAAIRRAFGTTSREGGK